MSREERIRRVDELIKNVPDFPKPGILFRDIFPMMKNHAVFADCVALLTEHIRDHHKQVDAIVGLDARGFIFGPMIAQQLGVAFVPIRKAGKLPGDTVKASFTLEYGSDVFECQKDGLKPGEKVVIVDDLLATGGTMAAACQLMKAVQADVLECMVVIELVDLKGRQKVPSKVFTLIEHDG